MSFLFAQTATPEEPGTGKKEEAINEPKAETPVEKQAFKIFDLVATLPDILGTIKDDASIAAAQTKLDEIHKKLKIEEAALLKLEVPDNEARKKLAAKMNIKEKVMNNKMMPVMMGLGQLPQATAMKVGGMMEKFGKQMNELEPTMSKYFQTDEEKDGK
jgi:hypothetical protein